MISWAPDYEIVVDITNNYQDSPVILYNNGKDRLKCTGKRDTTRAKFAHINGQ